MTEFDAWQRYEWTWRVTGISPDGHAMALLRDGLTRYGALTASDARNVRSGTRIRVAGLNIRPHRPPTRSGNPVLFTTVEDETGILQLICAGDALNTCTATLLVTPLIFVEGILRRKGAGASLQVEQVVPLSAATYRKRSMAPDYTAIRGKTPREVTVTHGIRQLVTAGDG
jgi:error-prone DNA polymerase